MLIELGAAYLGFQCLFTRASVRLSWLNDGNFFVSYSICLTLCELFTDARCLMASKFQISRPEDWQRASDPKKCFVQFFGTAEM